MRLFIAGLAAALLLVTAAGAQEGLDERLVGVWEQPESEVLSAGVEGKLQIELNADGSVELAFEGLFNLVEIGSEDGEEEGGDEGDLDLIGLSPTLSEDIEVSFTASGTWTADGENADLVVDEVELLFDGESAEAFFTEVGREVAGLLALVLSIPEEGRAVFEEEFIASFIEDLDEESLSQDFIGEGLGGPYRIEGSQLILVDDEDGTETVLLRADASAVLPRGWGQIKSAF